VSIAGWVHSVEFRSSAGPSWQRCHKSYPSTALASAKVAAITGDMGAKALIMPIDWEACPGNTKASDMDIQVPSALRMVLDYSEPPGQCSAYCESGGGAIEVGIRHHQWARMAAPVFPG
jgi:hypothetical protein